MAGYFYRLEGHEPVRMDDLGAWSVWMAEAAEGRIVGRDVIRDSTISTVFLGVDHNIEGPQIELFQTLVEGGEYDQYYRRYASWDEAEGGHKETLFMVGGEEYANK